MIGDKSWRKSKRAQIRERRRSLSESEVRQASDLVMEKLLSHPFLQSPRVIASYMSVSGEIDTVTLNRRFVEAGHTVALPVITPGVKGEMHFYSYADESSLVLNAFRIREPKATDENYVAPHVLEAMIVPLVGFNLKGDRLGMGGGYYDRMLKKVSADALSLGLAYDFQQIDELHRQSWDMPLDEIITPTRHIVCNGKGWKAERS